MRIAIVLVAIVALAGFVLLAAWALGRGRSPVLALILILGSGLAWTGIALRNAPGEAAVSDRPILVSDDGYVSSRTCRACHPSQYESWWASYHRKMTQVVTPETVIAEFDGVELETAENRYRLERRGEEFWVRIEPVGGAGAAGAFERRAVLSTGSHHLQLYWLAGEQGRQLEILPFHYLVPEKRWIPRSAFFVNPPDMEAGGGGDWNGGCVNCHVTGGQPRLEDGPADTQVGEFGIACEACHGPGALHVERQANPLQRYASHFGRGEDDSIVNPERMDKRRASELCGQCHANWAAATPYVAESARKDGYDFRPGGNLASQKRVLHRSQFPEKGLPLVQQVFVEGSWWPDGTVRTAGRELGALVQSACYRKGEMSCLSCHELHRAEDDPRSVEEWADDQLQVGMRGDAGCVECHASYAAKIEEHTHHPAESAGSRCMNCHMSYTTYGLLKAVRNHQIDSPRVTENPMRDKPNACSQCHLDQTLAWAADHLESWYGQAPPVLGEEERRVAASLLWLLKGDAGMRVLMAWSMGWEPAREASGEAWLAPYLALLLEDPYSAVRFVASRSLTSLEVQGELERILDA